MNSTNASASDSTAKLERLPYFSPQLKVFGQLRDLTDGGSGAIIEGAMMTAINRMA